MDEQEIFDRAVSGVIAQGRASSIEGVCLYRGRDGARCALGWLIPDEKYDPILESMSLHNILTTRPEVFPGVDLNEPKHIRLLRRLQFAHDSADREAGREPDEFVPLFISKARLAAQDLNLSEAALRAA